MTNRISEYKILIVDDDPSIIDILASFLGGKFKRQVAISGEETLKILNNNIVLPDLILLDLILPGMDGYEVCTKIKKTKRLKDIPIIFVSSLVDEKSIKKGFEVGCIDYIRKPFTAEELRARIKNHIKIYFEKVELEEDNINLNELVLEKVEEISKSQMATIFALAKLTESRDRDTGKHLEHVQSFSRLILEKMSIMDKNKYNITQEYIKTVENASILHDIGKVGIEDSILLKKGKLTEEEYEKMKKHTTIGGETLKELYNEYPKNEFIKLGMEIANYHHEHWDGSGYPEGLKGQEIPFSARVVAIADLYDALRSKRVYKDSFSHKKASSIIKESSGKQLDPNIVKSFLENEIEFKELYNKINSNNLN